MFLKAVCDLKAIREFNYSYRPEMPKTIGHLHYAPSIFVHYFVANREFILKYSPKTLNSGQNREIWRY